MGKRGRRIGTRRDDLYRWIVDEVASLHNGSLPTKYGLWSRYKADPENPSCNWTRFRQLFDELKDDGRLEDRDGIIVIVDSEWRLKRRKDGIGTPIVA